MADETKAKDKQPTPTPTIVPASAPESASKPEAGPAPMTTPTPEPTPTPAPTTTPEPIPTPVSTPTPPYKTLGVSPAEFHRAIRDSIRGYLRDHRHEIVPADIKVLEFTIKELAPLAHPPVKDAIV